MIHPKTIALDSSHWVKWIRDASSLDEQTRSKANQFAEELLARGYSILFSMHHLSELLAIEDASLADQRLAFIRKLPFISWIGSLEDGGLGSLVDVMAVESRLAFRGGLSAEQVRTAARPLLLKSGSGRHVVTDHPLFLAAARHSAISRSDRAKTIMAISPIEILPPKMTLRELIAGSVRGPQEAEQVISSMRDRIAAEIALHGDRRITNPAQRAKDFVETSLNLTTPPASVGELIATMLQIQEIDIHEVTTKTTIEQIGRLGLFRIQMKIASPLTGVSFEELKKRVTPEQLPHWIVGDALRKNSQRHPERRGSDLSDLYIAMLASYADIMLVDKRTAENFRRAKQKNPRLAKLTGRVRTSSSWASILPSLDI
jgi:hypothetical protein